MIPSALSIRGFTAESQRASMSVGRLDPMPGHMKGPKKPQKPAGKRKKAGKKK